jgi:hypothetical protein
MRPRFRFNRLNFSGAFAFAFPVAPYWAGIYFDKLSEVFTQE